MFVELLFTCKNLMTEFAFQGQLFHSADLKRRYGSGAHWKEAHLK